MKRYFLWGLTFIWWSLIIFFSGESAGSSWSAELLRLLFGIEGEELELWNVVVRKIGHFTYYGVLSLLLSISVGLRWTRSVAVMVAFFLTITTGAFDEIRQSVTAGREGALQDFLIDLVGAFVGVMIYLMATRSK